MRDTAQLAIDRAGWAGRVVTPLLRLILLVGVAAVAYLAFSLLDGAAWADSRPAGPDRPSVVGDLLAGAGDAASTAAGGLSTSDDGKASDDSAAADRTRAAASTLSTSDDGKASDDSAAADRTRAGAEAADSNGAKEDQPSRGEPAPGRAGHADRKASDPSVRAAAPVKSLRAAGERDAGDVFGENAGPAISWTSIIPENAARLDPVLDVAAPAVTDLLPLPPRLTAPVSTLPGAVFEPIVVTGQSVRDKLIATSSAVVSRAPPTPLTTSSTSSTSTTSSSTSTTSTALSPLPPLPALLAAGSAAGFAGPAWAAAPGFSGHLSGVSRPEVRLAGAGGSGHLPVRQPAAPESAAGGQVRAGGEGSPNQPAADGRLAWQPELTRGALVPPGKTKRGGQSAEADAPSG